MAEYVAAVRLNQAIETLRDGLYDPGNPSLRPYYTIDPLLESGSASFPDRLAAVNEEEFAAGDPLTTASEFSEQASDPGTNIFRRFAQAAGAGYAVNELIESRTVRTAAVTAPGGRFAAQATMVDADAAAAADQVGFNLPATKINNLRVIDDAHFAHRDAVVWDRFRRSFGFVEAVSRIRGI